MVIRTVQTELSLNTFPFSSMQVWCSCGHVKRPDLPHLRRVPAGGPESSAAQQAAPPGVCPAEPNGDTELSGQCGDRRQLPVELWRRIFQAGTEHWTARLPQVSFADSIDFKWVQDNWNLDVYDGAKTYCRYISVGVYVGQYMYKKKIQDRTETVLLLPKKLADKSLPQHFLGFSVRTN